MVIIGGGLLGCETGVYIAQQGKDVTIIEMLDEVAAEANIMHRRALMLELGKGVDIKTGLKCTEITDNGVAAVDKKGGKTLFDGDTVVVAVGLRSRTDIVDALRETAPEFIPIGDCLKSRTVLEAVRTGYDAGMSI